jgi:hypothetical protein
MLPSEKAMLNKTRNIQIKFGLKYLFSIWLSLTCHTCEAFEEIRELTALRMKLFYGKQKGSLITSYKYRHVEISWANNAHHNVNFYSKNKIKLFEKMWCFSEQVATRSKRCGATVLKGLSYQTCAVVHTHITYVLIDSVQHLYLLEEQIPHSS